MLNSKQLNEMNNIDITKVDRQILIDMNDIRIDSSLPSAKKMQSFFKQVKNPYCFICDNTTVRIRFITENKTLVKLLGNYFSSLK